MKPADLAAAITRHCAVACHSSEVDIVSDRRDANTIEARYLAIWLTSRLCPGWTHRRIGAAFNRDGATIGCALMHADKRRNRDPIWRAKCNQLYDELQGLRDGAAPKVRVDIPRPPSPNGKFSDVPLAPHDIRDTNWGFNGLRGGRDYFAEQNDAFAKAMREAGFKEGSAVE